MNCSDRGETTVLIDNDPEFLETIKRKVEKEKRFPPLQMMQDSLESLEYIQSNRVVLVISDLRMGGIDGVSLLEKAREFNPDANLILLTRYETTPDQDERLQRIGAETYRKQDIDLFFERLAETKPQAPDTETVDTLKARLSLFEHMHKEWIADLLDQLKAIPDLERAMVTGSGGPFTVQELIADIEDLTPRGIEHIRLWREVMKNLREKGFKT